MNNQLNVIALDSTIATHPHQKLNECDRLKDKDFSAQSIMAKILKYLPCLT
ncbi:MULTISPECIES: hypothetical protein [unclassified Okeania]|uniref:hypothetical protein n=1 Tax=unclassified Okeania TaxID=2634635 RepID=UPI0013C0C170|nr:MULTISPECIES: hypothetical protein [unclassified Okeania]NEN91091.1 hypothetical protein [Okeania sp. SIO3H1]NET24951.1 hypothetical protein [Okeania sp. SIO1I7]NET40465.1 hypothetical protein [Okeania sp. SIO2B3]